MRPMSPSPLRSGSATTGLLVARSRSIDHEMKLTNADPTGGRWPCARPLIYGSVSCGEFNPLDRTSDRTLIKLVWDIDDNQTLKFTSATWTG